MALNLTGVDVTATIDHAEDTCQLTPYLSTSLHSAHGEDKLIGNYSRSDRALRGRIYLPTNHSRHLCRGHDVMSHIFRLPSERTHVQLGETEGAETVSISLSLYILSTFIPADVGCCSKGWSESSSSLRYPRASACFRYGSTTSLGSWNRFLSSTNALRLLRCSISLCSTSHHMRRAGMTTL